MSRPRPAHRPGPSADFSASAGSYDADGHLSTAGHDQVGAGDTRHFVRRTSTGALGAARPVPRLPISRRDIAAPGSTWGATRSGPAANGTPSVAQMPFAWNTARFTPRLRTCRGIFHDRRNVQCRQVGRGRSWHAARRTAACVWNAAALRRASRSTPERFSAPAERSFRPGGPGRGRHTIRQARIRTGRGEICARNAVGFTPRLRTYPGIFRTRRKVPGHQVARGRARLAACRTPPFVRDVQGLRGAPQTCDRSLPVVPCGNLPAGPEHAARPSRQHTMAVLPIDGR